MSIVRSIGATAALVALSALPALAQQQAVSAGVEVGVNESRISPDLSGQSISRGPGVYVGGYVLIPAFPVVGIQIEGVYSQKKTHLSSAQDLELDYFEVPVLAKLSLFKGLYMLEGVAFDFPVSAHLEPTNGAQTDIKSQVTNPDVGLVIAVAYPIDRVHVEGRYEGGFRSVNSTVGAAGQRSRTFTLLARFPL
jgi:hypothetical protein